MERCVGWKLIGRLNDRQLHAHLISQDFSSVSMKTKKHWNSFTTDYFIPIKQMKNIISSHGRAKVSNNVEDGNTI